MAICAELLNKICKQKIRSTLLAVCPNSEAVLEAAIVAAIKANSPLIYAVTLNQVDLDGGYTGWTQADFVQKLKELLNLYKFPGPVAICLDHGGPYAKDAHRMNKLSLKEAMEAAKRSIAACLDAGYHLLHIDTTIDPQYPAGLPVEEVVNRAVTLIKFAEEYRREKGYPPVDYEVGSEEVKGGLTSEESFEMFLKLLQAKLAHQVPNIWPCFVVGQVGTDLHTTRFDPKTAKKLVEIASRYGCFLKGHYTDFVDNPSDYPKAGMGGANVGPEFTVVEYDALVDLENQEKELKRQGQIEELSGITQALREAVVKSQRWRKWLKEDEQGKEFDELKPERQEWLIQTGCRYVWSDPEVVNARQTLYRNLDKQNINGPGLVVEAIADSIYKYYTAFNLIDLNSRL